MDATNSLASFRLHMERAKVLVRQANDRVEETVSHQKCCFCHEFPMEGYRMIGVLRDAETREIPPLFSCTPCAKREFLRSKLLRTNQVHLVTVERDTTFEIHKIVHFTRKPKEEAPPAAKDADDDGISFLKMFRR
eukprot:jgi/Mesvir1/11137/Mv04579-RA.1